MTKTCAGFDAGVASGEALGVGAVRIVGGGIGLARTCEVVEVQPAISKSPVRLAANRWEMVIRPERGGRITSLRLDGEEILDQGIGVDQPTAEGFVEGGAWGWDEMVPNVEPTDALPDHGEAWRVSWEVLHSSQRSAAMRALGRIVPWELTRTISLDEDVRVSYVYRNVGDFPHPAYWCAHPLFKYEGEMAHGLPSPGPGSSKKVFLPPGSTSSFQLGWSSGLGIEMSWDPFLTPDVAIWICNGDLGGYYQIAVEPATASPLLAPGESFDWWLQIRAL